jgi:CubicO group peptidase (beta-lactamase class C family)
MKRNTIVQLWSNTKPVTAASLMSLVESGQIQLSDPVEKHLPEFEGIMVYNGLDANGNITTVPTVRKMTIADLSRHTAGFCNNPNVPGLSDLIAEIDPRNWENELNQMVTKFASIPLWSQPGTRWEYGPGMDIEAALIQRVSGKPYHEFLRENILDPLQLNETRYFVPEKDRDRLSKVYGPDDEGTLVRIPDSSALTYPTRHWPMKAGGFGLTSTIDEYMRYARMLLNKGELDGVRVLSEESVRIIGTDHLPDTISQRSWLPSKGQVGFGVNMAVRIAPPASPDENKGAVGEFFWDGAATTLMWVDPANDLAAVLFVQKIPFDGSLHKDFRWAVYGPEEVR